MHGKRLHGTVGLKKRDGYIGRERNQKSQEFRSLARYTGNPARAVCPAVSSEPKDPTSAFLGSGGLSVRLLVFLFIHAQARLEVYCCGFETAQNQLGGGRGVAEGSPKLQKILRPAEPNCITETTGLGVTQASMQKGMFVKQDYLHSFFYLLIFNHVLKIGSIVYNVVLILGVHQSDL